MALRNTVGPILTNGLASAMRGESFGNIKERGWAVAANLGLDSMAVNLFFQGLSSAGNALTGGGANSGLGALGLVLAGEGGSLRRGMLIWNETAGSYRGMNQFTFPMNPASLHISRSPVWAETNVPGQNRPMYQFVNGGAKEIKFTLNFFYADRTREVIRDQMAALESLCDRRYTGELAGAYDGPPPVSFHFGDYFDGREKFIVKSFEVEAFDLFDPRTLLPMRANVDLTLAEVMDTTAVSGNTKDRHGVRVGLANSVNIPSIITDL